MWELQHVNFKGDSLVELFDHENISSHFIANNSPHYMPLFDKVIFKALDYNWYLCVLELARASQSL